MSSRSVTITAKSSLSLKAGEALDIPDTDQFFWSYTEEPHRTRRQAIIKAHPEVFCCMPSYCHSSRLTEIIPGHKALWTRTPYKVLCDCRCCATIALCNRPPEHRHFLAAISRHSLRDRGDGESKPLSCHP